MQPEGTVFLVDDDSHVRQSLVRLFAEVNQPVQAFSSASEFLEAYDPATPGCLVLDVRMPGISGTALQEKLATEGATIPIIFITGHGDVPMAVAATQRGAIDFIEKPIRPQRLIDCIGRALVLDSENRRRKADRDATAARLALLTPGEREVMDLAASGMTNKAIAAQLGVSPQAIDNRRSKAMKKMNVDNIPEFVKEICKVEAGQAIPPRSCIRQPSG